MVLGFHAGRQLFRGLPGQCRMLMIPPMGRTSARKPNMRLYVSFRLGAQQEAVLGRFESSNGVVSVRAGPGTGKTELLARHAALLICKGAVPSEIFILTHSGEAAKELSQKIRSFFWKSDGLSEVPLCGTFNDFVTRILQEEAGTLPPVITPTQRRRVVSLILAEDLGFDSRSIQRVVLDLAQDSISVAKSFEDPHVGVSEAIKRLQYQLEKIEEKYGFRDNGVCHLSEMGAADFVSNLYRSYSLVFEEKSCLDFDDQVLFAIRLLNEYPEVKRKLQHRFRHILLDESQELTSAQAALVLRLFADSPVRNSLFMVGDRDQTIFGSRGSTIQLQDYVKKLGGQEFVLHEGFRMTPPIVEAVRATLRGQEWDLPVHTPEEFEKYARQKPILFARPHGKDAEVQYAVDCVQYFRKSRIKLSEIAIIIRSWDPDFHLLTKALTDAGYTVSPRVMLEETMPVETFVEMLRPEARNSAALFENISAIRLAQRRCGFDLTPVKKIKNTVLAIQQSLSQKGHPSANAAIKAAKDTGYWEVLKMCYLHPTNKMTSACREGSGSLGFDDLVVATVEEPGKRESKPVPGISILSAHSAKGREFDAVIVLDIGWAFPKYCGHPEEEEKLLYVAMTRARKHLALSFPYISMQQKIGYQQEDFKFGMNFVNSVASSRLLSFARSVLVRGPNMWE